MKSYMEYIDDYISPDNNDFMNASDDRIVEGTFDSDFATEAQVGGKMTRGWAFIKNMLRQLAKVIQDWWNKSAISKLKATLKSKVVPYKYDDQMRILKQAVDKAKAKSQKSGSKADQFLADAAFATIFTLRDVDILNKLKMTYRAMKAVNVKNMAGEINGFVQLIGGKDTIDAFKQPVFGRSGGILDIDLSAIDKLVASSTSDDRVKNAQAAGNQAKQDTINKMNQQNQQNNKPGNTPTQVSNASIILKYDDSTYTYSFEQTMAPAAVEINAKAAAAAAQPQQPNGKQFSKTQIKDTAKKNQAYAFNKALGSQLTSNDVETIGNGLTLIINIYSELITKTAWFVDRLEKQGRANPTVVLNLMKDVQTRLYGLIRICTSMVTDIDTDNGKYQEHDSSEDGADDSLKPNMPMQNIQQK